MEKKSRKFDIIGTLLAVVACILMFTCENDMIISGFCLATSFLYFVSYSVGERFEHEFLGIKTALPYSILWAFNAIIWFI